MAQKYVKQYGLYRTGTNYLRALLQHNFDVRVLVNVLGWKHGPYRDPLEWIDAHEDGKRVKARTSRKGQEAWVSVDIHPHDLREAWDAGDIGMVCISKHPMAFAYSVERWGKVPVEKACEEYNERYADWTQNCPGLLMRYEDVIADPANRIARMGAFFGLAPHRWPCEDVTRTAKPSEDRNLNLGDPFERRDFYLSGEYREHMSQRAKEAAEKIIDWELAALMGYQQEQPA